MRTEQVGNGTGAPSRPVEDDAGAPPPSLPRRLRGLLLLAAGLGAAVLAGIAGIVVLAWVTAVPVLLVGGGWLVHAAAVVAVVRLARRRFRPDRRAAAAATAGALAFTTAVAALLFFQPYGRPGVVAATAPGQQEVTLSTGSRILYARARATGTPRPQPVVFLHGGPGVADLAGDLAYFRQLTADGFDVYVYDQFGAGRAGRAADPRDYTVGRAAADLEAFRQEVVGTDQMILIAHSWGGTIAATYLAGHAGHVSRVVFSSPGEIHPGRADTIGTGMLARLSLGQKVSFYSALLAPRGMLVWSVAQIDPLAAHRLAGDREMDARFDTIYARSAPGLYCDTAHRRGQSPGSLGFYANTVPQALRGPASPDPHPALRAVHVPALVLKGSCDYLPWSVATDYRRTLPDAGIGYLPGAGHQAYVDRPVEYLAELRAFLLDRPLPIAPLRSDAVPVDFEGPQ